MDALPLQKVALLAGHKGWSLEQKPQDDAFAHRIMCENL
jgi:hypothetical protein